MAYKKYCVAFHTNRPSKEYWLDQAAVCYEVGLQREMWLYLFNWVQA